MKKNLITAAMLFILSAVFSTAVFSYPQVQRGGEQQSARSAEANATGETVIVVDAGHGGVDAGASAKDGTSEKDINLAIALKLKEKAEKYGVHVVMTREGDSELLEGYDGSGGRKRYDMENRKRIIEENNPVLTVSIHLNSYPADALIYGAQVFYPNEDNTEKEVEHTSISSADFARSVQNAIEKAIPDGEEKEAAAKGDIFLFREIKSPIILVECGFLSNSSECEKLKDPEYQNKMASAIWEGINGILCIPENGKPRIVDSANKA